MSFVKLVRNTITLEGLNQEVSILAMDEQPFDYVIFGYIDISNMALGDVIEVSLYLAVDGASSIKAFRSRYAFNSAEKAIYIEPIFVCRDCRAKLTINQIAGTPRTYSYVLVVAPINQALSELIRNILFRDMA